MKALKYTVILAALTLSACGGGGSGEYTAQQEPQAESSVPAVEQSKPVPCPVWATCGDLILQPY